MDILKTTDAILKRILVLDGGGAKGPMQLAALRELEAATGRRTYALFDLIVGTSVGGINAALLASGMYSADHLLNVMAREMPKVFKRRLSLRHKYSKDSLRVAFSDLFGRYAFLGDLKTRTIITSYEDTEGRMHFFKSWEAKDSLMYLYDAVDRTSAAPLFFGPVVEYDAAKVWLDGGVGIFNNPSLYAYGEVLRQGWDESEVVCYSLGCGNKSQVRTFAEASDGKKLAQVLNFVDPLDGGLARRSASSELCNFLSGRPWSFHRINCHLPEKMDGMDKVRYTDEYIARGVMMGWELSKAFILHS